MKEKFVENEGKIAIYLGLNLLALHPMFASWKRVRAQQPRSHSSGQSGNKALISHLFYQQPIKK